MDHLNSVTSGEGAKSQTPLTDEVLRIGGNLGAIRALARQMERDRSELMKELWYFARMHCDEPCGCNNCRSHALLSRLSETPATTGSER